ncbi:V-type proton ATPase subunit G [Phyllosticta capitalensis]|uniref:V-type proton ATPase subunit G n=1 Tax=Phyllosticta capitalensis TaxID=121624 RepID=A0ABR1YFX8_9PEZI
MSAQNSAGIQTLLDAEREAQKIVQKAREYRTKRVKDARSEAQKEVDEYKKQKEEEFKKFETEHSSGNQKAEEEANKETETKLKEIKDIGSKSGSKVVEQLLAAVTDVKPEPPAKD